MAKATPKTKAKSRKEAALPLTDEIADDFIMDPKPFKDSLKRISEQAKDWGYMARPIDVSTASQAAPRLDDIHGVIREKLIQRAPPPTPSNSSSWSKWVCMLSVITLIFSISQTVWLTRHTVKLHEAEMEQLKELKKKIPTPQPVIRPIQAAAQPPAKRLASGDFH